jgi:hypothetical protein
MSEWCRVSDFFAFHDRRQGLRFALALISKNGATYPADVSRTSLSRP